jgi:spore coat polysaccharide biosynthesis protein SpsF (cytidylyltransferase family)
MIVYMARRAMRALLLDSVAVVTSTDATDDALAETVAAQSLPVFRGDLHDVLKRYADAAQAHAADEVIRLTGDCPLTDPSVIDAVVAARRSAGADYASNVDPSTYPDGFDVECFARETLERAHRAARHPAEREHVTLWMRSDASGLRRANVRALADLSHLRLTVDYPDDLEVVRRLTAQEDSDRPMDLFDILRALSKQPDLLMLNRHPRNEGLAKSLAQGQ